MPVPLLPKVNGSIFGAAWAARTSLGENAPVWLANTVTSNFPALLLPPTPEMQCGVAFLLNRKKVLRSH
jgi:hypothetical protein